MSRLILFLEVILGTLVLAFRLNGDSLISRSLLSPFLGILLVPAFASISVWKWEDIRQAVKDAFPGGRKSPVSPRSSRIWKFAGEAAVTGAIMGMVAGIALYLRGIGSGNSAPAWNGLRGIGISVAASALAVIVFMQVKELVGTKRESGESNALVRRFSLSGREAGIVQLVAEGLSNREIASRLYLSEDTVKNHLTAIFRKTGVKNRGGLAGLYSTADREGEKSPSGEKP